MDKRLHGRLSILYLIITLSIINLLHKSPHEILTSGEDNSPHSFVYCIQSNQTGSDAGCQSLALIL